MDELRLNWAGLTQWINIQDVLLYKWHLCMLRFKFVFARVSHLISCYKHIGEFDHVRITLRS